jgi:hypothetical protein
MPLTVRADGLVRQTSRRVSPPLPAQLSALFCRSTMGPNMTYRSEYHAPSDLDRNAAHTASKIALVWRLGRDAFPTLPRLPDRFAGCCSSQRNANQRSIRPGVPSGLASRVITAWERPSGEEYPGTADRRAAAPAQPPWPSSRHPPSQQWPACLLRDCLQEQ